MTLYAMFKLFKVFGIFSLILLSGILSITAYSLKSVSSISHRSPNQAYRAQTFTRCRILSTSRDTKSLQLNFNPKTSISSQRSSVSEAAQVISKKNNTVVHGQSQSEYLPDNSSSPSGLNLKVIVPLVTIAAAGLAYFVSSHGHLPFAGGYDVPFDLNSKLDQLVTEIENLGPYGYIYFAAVYILAEVLAIPAMPLTASSGYLFGLIPGFLTVLLSASIAASISFFVGRSFLRTWVQGLAANSKEWRAIDRAVENEGFKVVLLLRLSPLLPFALSNYLYGITSVDFWSFFAATFLGFAPGTFGIVYAGNAGKEIFSNDGAGLPWYAYAGGLALLLLFGRTIAKVATDAIRNIEEEEAKTKM